MISLQGCSGGESVSNSVTFTEVVPKTIVGTASQGAPLSGTAYLKDMHGTEKASSIDVNGRFKFNIDGMSSPFILKAGGYYSAATAASITNINPLTDLCVKKAAGVSSVESIYNNPSTLSALIANISPIANNLKSNLDGLYPASVPATQRDFMHGSLVIDEGVDLLFTRISISSTAGDFNINLNGQTLVTIISSYGIVTVNNNAVNIANASAAIFPVAGGIATTTAYAQSDMQGTWYWLTLENGGGGLWQFAKVTIDSSGNATLEQYTDSGGGAPHMTSTTLLLSSSGTVTSSSRPAAEYFSGVMSTSKDLVVITHSPDVSVTPHTSGITLLVKAGSNYTTADLQGTWKMQGFSLPGTSTNFGWQRADVTINNLGAALVTNHITNLNSGAGAEPNNTDYFAVNSLGVVTMTGFPQFRGILSADKNLMVMVMTNSDGSVVMGFLSRTATGLTRADMAGTWKMNYLQKDIYGTDWGRGITTVDAAGNTVFDNIIQSGISWSRLTGAVTSMSSSGSFTVSGEWGATFGGTMAINKNLMIGTVTQDPAGTPTPALLIWTK
ncbi:MAG: hypothetical protein PHI31_17745 [Desulfuromonadaceae bacterium]|nr:hypothetical protein [Desulfuromonadaceae bacterium]